MQVGIDLQRHLRGQRVEVEEIHRLGDGVLDHHAPGVAVDQLRGLGPQLVGDQQRRLLVAEVGDGQLLDLDRIAAQLDLLAQDPRVAVAAPDVVKGEPFPAGPGQRLADHRLQAAAQGQEADADVLHAGQHCVGGEPAVEREFAGKPAGALSVGLDQAQHGLVLGLLAHGGVNEVEGVFLGVAHEEGEPAALAAAALGDIMLLEEGLAAMVGDGMEVEVEGVAAGHAEAVDGVEPGIGSEGQQAGIGVGGILGEGGALGDGVEPGEEAVDGIEDLAGAPPSGLVGLNRLDGAFRRISGFRSGISSRPASGRHVRRAHSWSDWARL